MFLLVMSVIGIQILRESIPKDLGKKYDYYYAEPWEKKQIEKLFCRQGGCQKLHDFPSIYSDEFHEELKEVFSHIDQLRGMEKHIHVQHPIAGRHNEKLATMLRDASIGYLPTCGDSGIGKNTNEFYFFDEETGFVEKMWLSNRTMNQIAEYMSEKYVGFGSPCILIYDPKWIYDFRWVTEANKNSNTK